MAIKIYGNLRIQENKLTPNDTADYQLKVANDFPGEITCSEIRLRVSTIPSGMTISPNPIEVGSLVGGFIPKSVTGKDPIPNSYKILTISISTSKTFKPGDYTLTITPTYNYTLIKQTEATTKSITVVLPEPD